MGRRANDLAGRSFGDPPGWLALRRLPRNARGRHAVWECACQGCGTIAPVAAKNLVHGVSVRCRGCSNELQSKRRPRRRNLPYAMTPDDYAARLAALDPTEDEGT